MTKQSEQTPPTLIGRRIRRVFTRSGLHAFEAEYDPWSRLPEHGHSSPFFTYVLRGRYVERTGHYARRCDRGAVIFHHSESHTNEVGPAGTMSFNVELDPELWRELTDSVGIATAIAGRVLTGDIEWAAFQVWREFRQPDTTNAIRVEEATVHLCHATRCACVRGVFEPHQRLGRCIAYLDAHPMDA